MEFDEAPSLQEAAARRDPTPGELLRDIRKQAGLSLKAVSARIGGKTHFTTIAKLENGRMAMTYDWARRLSLALDVPAMTFFLPERSNDSAHLVPVFSLFDVTTRKPDGVIESYVAYISNRTDLFAVNIIGCPDILETWPLYHAIVDPKKTDLIDNVLSAFILPGSNSPIVGLYHSIGKKTGTLLPWPQVDRKPIVLFPHEVRVLGWVLELQRTLIGNQRDAPLSDLAETAK